VLFVDAGWGDASVSPSLTIHVWPSAAERASALAQAPADARLHARVVVWDSTLERFGADQLNQRFRVAAGRAMTSEAYAGWVAVKILWEASLRAHSVDPGVLSRALLSPTSRFDGHKGSALSFRASDHRLSQPLYLIIEKNGARKVMDVDPCNSAVTRACQ
jgi:ABC transporter substrate binding protein (PQQ-dependent alcohol dehydrogenase system)